METPSPLRSCPVGSVCLRDLVRVLLLPLLLALLVSASTAAQQSNASYVDRETFDRLLKQVQDLEAQLAQLKAQQTKADSMPASPAMPSPDRVRQHPEEPASPDSHLTSPPAPPAEESSAAQEEEPTSAGIPSLKIRGFADVGFEASDRRGQANSFSLGQLDLFVTSRLSDRFNVISDIVFEARTNNEFGVDADRLLIQYSPSDYFNVGVGRYLTAIGYYNAAYQHGTWVQTTTGRPLIFQFDESGGILPTHNVGVTANGLIPSGHLGLHWVAEVGNGRASRSPSVPPIQNVTDEDNRKSVNLGLYVRPDWASGLQVGFSVYYDRLIPQDQPKVNQTISDVYFVYVKPTFEFLNEGVFIRNAPLGGPRVFNTPAFYTQISRRFGKIRPYFRYQYLNIPESDPIFGNPSSETGGQGAIARRRFDTETSGSQPILVLRSNGPSVGMRFDLNDFTAFKVQYDRTAQRGLSAVNGLGLQFACTF